jgi:hypothetical protein
MVETNVDAIMKFLDKAERLPAKRRRRDECEEIALKVLEWEALGHEIEVRTVPDTAEDARMRGQKLHVCRRCTIVVEVESMLDEIVPKRHKDTCAERQVAHVHEE